MRKGKFDLDDLREQLAQMQKIGGMAALMGMMPGVGKMKKQIAAAPIDDKVLKRQVAIIDSMTPKERATPTSSRPAARSASPPAPAPRSRRSTSSSRCTARWPT
jgi:signal recognition particle GTPase